MLKDTIMQDSYGAVLTVIEFVARRLEYVYQACIPDPRLRIISIFNRVFEREFIGYRFIDGWITPITGENEQKAIQNAIAGSDESAKEHFRKALSFLSDRDAPDYANSIKESISAVEALCANITGATGKDSTLGSTIQHLNDAGVAIHPALKRAFSNLYGYTSDATGIRHAGQIDGESATFAEAKFMLVACSAFVNYLLELKADIV